MTEIMKSWGRLAAGIKGPKEEGLPTVIRPNKTSTETKPEPVPVELDHGLCVVCFEDHPTSNLITCGRPGLEALVCSTCVTAHIKTTLDSGYDGRIPRVRDPVDASLVLPFSVSKSLLDENSLNIIQRRSAAVLSLQCGSCHTRRDLMIDAVPEFDSSAALEGGLGLVNCDFESFFAAREDFLRGALSENEFYRIIRKLFQNGIRVGDRDGPCKVMKVILQSIQDPERRASLHMIYLKEFPDVHTKCCKKRHCFRCHIKDYHPGKTCEQYQASVATVIDVVPCPTCGLQLTKGDGCNSVNCVCGRNFDWATELRNLNLEVAKIFTEEHPGDTAFAASVVAYQNPEEPRARAFIVVNGSDMARARAKHWAMLYPNCPAEASLFYSQASASDLQGYMNAEHRAMQSAFSNTRVAEITSCRQRQKDARRKAFEAAYAGDHERALAASMRHPVTALQKAQSTFLDGLGAGGQSAALKAAVETRIEENLTVAWDFLHTTPESAEDAALRAQENGAGGDTRVQMVDAFAKLYPARVDSARCRRFVANFSDPVARVADVLDLEMGQDMNQREIKDMEAFHARHADEVQGLRAERACARAQVFGGRYKCTREAAMDALELRSSKPTTVWDRSSVAEKIAAWPPRGGELEPEAETTQQQELRRAAKDWADRNPEAMLFAKKAKAWLQQNKSDGNLADLPYEKELDEWYENQSQWRCKFCDRSFLTPSEMYCHMGLRTC